MTDLEPITVELTNRHVIVSAPDFNLTPEQENEIAEWWRDRLDAEVARQLGALEIKIRQAIWPSANRERDK